MIKKFLPVVAILALSYFAIKPLFIPGFFPMHDDTQVARVFEMNKSLADGMFPVRWVSDLGYGYGYPIFNFYAPLAYYAGGFITFFSDALFATKAMMVIGIVLSGIFMYLFAREFWGDFGGMLSGILYLYAPYHAVDVYVRGDTAEFWAYAFVPLAFLGVYKIFLSLRIMSEMAAENSKFKTSAFAKASADKLNSKLKFRIKNYVWLWLIVGSIGYAAIILSHNLTAMMVTPFLLLFGVFLYTNLRMQEHLYKPYFVLLPILLGMMLAAFYWLPALAEMRYTNVFSQIGGGADYHDHFVCLGQLWDSPWGYGGSMRGCYDGLSFKIGKIHLLLSLFSLGALALMWKKSKRTALLVIFFVLSLLLCIFIQLKESVFLWDSLPQMAFLQYPWRFLLLVSFFVSILGGSALSLLQVIFEHLRNNNSQIYFGCLCGIMIVGVVYFTADVFAPQTIMAKTVSDYTNPYALKWTTSRISDEYMPKGFYKPGNPNEIPQTIIPAGQNSVELLSLHQQTQLVRAEVNTHSKRDILVQLAYFPGWHVYMDGKQIWFKYFNKGLLVTIPQGKHLVEVRYSQTVAEKIGNFFSLAGVCIMILGIIMVQRKKKYEHETA